MSKNTISATGTVRCPHCSTCRPFFNYTGQFYKELGQAFINFYCHKSYKKCARHYLMENLDKDAVPMDVFPNQEMRAHSIVKESQKSYS